MAYKIIHSLPHLRFFTKIAIVLYRLLHQLGDFEVKSSGGTTGDGVNLIATCDSANSKVQILIYNHRISETQNSASADDITLSVLNIPWTSGWVNVEHYLVDTTYSNSNTKWVTMGKPVTPNHAQWDELHTASLLEHLNSTATIPLSLN